MTARLRRLVAVAERCAWRARGAPALVVCGVPASGKSHLADALGAMAGCPVLSSDVVRKELGGLAPHDRGTPSLYTAEVSARVYRELGAARRRRWPRATGSWLTPPSAAGPIAMPSARGGRARRP